MKKTYSRVRFMTFVLLLFISGQAMAQQNSNSTDDVRTKVHQVARVHKLVRSLPFTEDYIQNTVMAEILTHRKEVAPHFPERANMDKDHTASALFTEWITKYPQEHTAYINYVEGIYRRYHHK